MTKHITVAYGDGIGPEIMESTLEILKEAGADLEINTIEYPRFSFKCCRYFQVVGKIPRG